jgi:UDPglucose 6-dehydrogenase
VNQTVKSRISIIGLGKLGAPMAAVFANKGFETIGLDLNSRFVEAINEGRAPVEEPQLQEMIDGCRSRLRATTSFEEAVSNSDVSFIIVPTPSGADRLFSNRFVLDAVGQIGAALRSKPKYHVVVVTSTVMPGATNGEIRAALEVAAGREVGPDLGLCYNPEFIALGSVVHDMLRPDIILIGESDKKAGDVLQSIYRASTESDPEFHRMNLVNAELTKISINTYVTTKISYANMIADMCDHLVDADANVVTAAVGGDSRVGRKYLKGAIGYGGPCFPRDNKAFAALGRRLGVNAELAEATDKINEHQIVRLTGAVEALAHPGATVALLGMSYKPDTAVIEESQGVMLARILARQGYRVIVSDPLATEAASAVLGAVAEAAPDAAAAVREADLVVIMTPWPDFKTIPPDAFRRGSGAVTVIDPWRLIDAASSGANVIYLGSGGWKLSARKTMAA